MATVPHRIPKDLQAGWRTEEPAPGWALDKGPSR